jgi:hypothetical protein
MPTPSRRDVAVRPNHPVPRCSEIYRHCPCEVCAEAQKAAGPIDTGDGQREGGRPDILWGLLVRLAAGIEGHQFAIDVDDRYVARSG